MKRLEGKAAIITGAGDGIGRHIALAFAHQGASVLVVDIKAEGVPETVRLIESKSDNAPAFGAVLDIGQEAAVKEAVALCASKFGRIDCIVNNAADQTQRSLENVTGEIWDRVLAVNVRAAMEFAREALPFLLAQSGSSIINIASVRGNISIPGGVAYDTSKAAMQGLTRLLAVELGLKGIRVNAINPGQIMSFGEERWRSQRSERSQKTAGASYALGRVGRPEEIANVAVFLASEEASFITGQSLNVDGGMGIMNPETAVMRAVQAIEDTQNR